MTKFVEFFWVVVMAIYAVQGATLNNKEAKENGDLKIKQLEVGDGLQSSCPSYCDYCSSNNCYYYEDEFP